MFLILTGRYQSMTWKWNWQVLESVLQHFVCVLCWSGEWLALRLTLFTPELAVRCVHQVSHCCSLLSSTLFIKATIPTQDLCIVLHKSAKAWVYGRKVNTTAANTTHTQACWKCRFVKNKCSVRSKDLLAAMGNCEFAVPSRYPSNLMLFSSHAHSLIYKVNSASCISRNVHLIQR